MKKILIFSAIILIAAGCGRQVSQQDQSGQDNNSGSIVTDLSSNSLATFTSTKYNFTIQYSRDYDLNAPVKGDSDWSSEMDGKGVRVATITIPQSFQPGTNFSEAKVTIGMSSDKAVLSKCLTPTQGEKAAGHKSIHGTLLYEFTNTGAAAGNIYETTAYRAIYLSRCYSVEEVIHSGNIGNYDPSMGIKQFNKQSVQSALEAVVKTFDLN